jgi:exodeoxyribonuclease VII small subunit
MSDDSASLTDLTFEDAYAQLEDIAAQLESGDLSLDESVALYERGQALAQHCSDLLDAAELRIRQINDAGDVSPLS